MYAFRGLFVVAAVAAVADFSAVARAQDTLPELPPPLTQTEIQAATEDEVTVTVDLAVPVRIPEGTETLAIGNPAIADVTRPQAGKVSIVTGKSYGTTNLLALDRDGATLREFLIHVAAPKTKTVTVLRGGARETWSCTPRCEQTVTLGDAPDYFKAQTDQIGSRNGMAGQN